MDRDIAEIKLPSGIVIDVEWCEDDKKYIVTLFRYEYEDMIVQTPCDSVSDVIEEVKNLAYEFEYEYESGRIESTADSE